LANSLFSTHYTQCEPLLAKYATKQSPCWSNSGYSHLQASGSQTIFNLN
jgi:hypothetical protein